MSDLPVASSLASEGLHGKPKLVASPASSDWLIDMIFSAKMMAAAAEFIPAPYIRAALTTVVNFLETVDKINRNREDLKDLCTNILEIVAILREEFSIHGNTGTPRFMGLCDDFIGLLNGLHGDLEKLNTNRQSIRGWVKEMIRATSAADQIERCKGRLIDLRLNFMLVATINTTLNVAEIHKNVTATESAYYSHGQRFRNIALGDINLLYESPTTSTVYKIKCFTARIFGQASQMTVATYEDEEEWCQDLELFSRMRHPNVWQLFGVSMGTGLHALIFHDEPVPLPIYRQFHRPECDLVWACIEGMLNCSEYHYWRTRDDLNGLEATICVKREPIQICLTMPDPGREYHVDRTQKHLSLWHSPFYKHRQAPVDTIHISTIVQSIPYTTLPGALARHLDRPEFYAALTPSWHRSSVPYTAQTQFFLGSVVTQSRDSDSGIIYWDPFSLVAYIPKSCSEIQMQEWTLGVVADPSRTALYKRGTKASWKRSTFPSGSFKAAEPTETLEAKILLSSFIKFDDMHMNMLTMSWLSQAHASFGRGIFEGDYRYGLMNLLGCVLVRDVAFQHVLHPHGTTREAHLFACPIDVRYDGPRVGIQFPVADHFYWALDPMGTTRLSQDECDSLGIPRLRFHFLPSANFWHEYHYGAIRSYCRANGLDPYTYDVTRVPELPLIELNP